MTLQFFSRPWSRDVQHDSVVPVSHSSGSQWVHYNDSQRHSDDITDRSVLQEKRNCSVRLRPDLRILQTYLGAGLQILQVSAGDIIPI